MQSRMSKGVLLFTLLWMWLFSACSLAASIASPLPADQAFPFSLTVNGPQFALAEWRIAPGYYLYSKRVHVVPVPIEAADVRLPQGELKYTTQGRLEVFSGTISVPVLAKNNATQFRVSIDYQGCSESGFCYPPIHKTYSLNFTSGTVTEDTTSLSNLLTNQNGIAALFGSQHFGITLLIFAGLGLLLAFTPCVLPMVPIVTGIIVGHKRSVSAKKGFLLSSTYVFGSSLTYALAGVAAALMGSSLQVWLQKPIVIILAASLFVLLAFSLFGWYELKLPRQWQNKLTKWSNHQQGGTYAGVFFMGMISTLIISPCVTAPLVGVLIYISQSGDMILGGSALFAMGLGMGLPLILIGMSAGKWLPKSGAWMEAVKKLFGVLMLAMGIWLLSRAVPSLVTMILTGLLLLGIAFFLSVSLPRVITWRKLSRSLGVLLGLSGIIVIVGASLPNAVPTWLGANQASPLASSFTVIRDLAMLNKQLSQAQLAHKPVLLDFYADWCESCVVMDKNVFSLTDVKQALSNYVLLRADLTENSHDDQAIMKHFNVIAPPTVLFFNVAGREMNAQRIVGEVNAQEFLGRLQSLGNQSGFKK